MKSGKCKYCGCNLCDESTRPDGSVFIGCSNCSYTIELGNKYNMGDNNENN